MHGHLLRFRNEAVWNVLPTLKNLRTVRLDRTALDDAALRAIIENCARLEEITVRERPVTIRAFDEAAQWPPGLAFIDVDEETNAAIARIREARRVQGRPPAE